MLIRILTIIAGLATPLLSSAAMMPLSDDELGEAVGQAFLQIDRTSAGSMDYTRFTFGMDVDVSLNADLIEFGRYPRAGETAPSDIRINDFALGTINADGSINPFKIRDPFFELAFEDVGGQQALVGVRIGFGQALGKLSGNIEVLTGNLEVDVVGRAKPIRDRASWGDRQLLNLAGVWDNSRLRADAVLVTSSGQPDPIRAEWIGVKNGDALGCVDGGGCAWGALTNAALGLFPSQGCSILSLDTCFRLSNFRTLDVGNNGAPATGMFLSFQTKSISWIDNGAGTQTVSGAFLNIPNGGISVDFEQSFNGIERMRTKFVDPYYP